MVYPDGYPNHSKNNPKKHKGYRTSGHPEKRSFVRVNTSGYPEDYDPPMDAFPENYFKKKQTTLVCKKCGKGIDECRCKR